MNKGMFAKAVLGLLIALGPASSLFAQTTLSNWEKYLEPVQTSNQVTAYTFNSFGESTNLQDGSTSFSWTDIDIRGNNALPVRFQRTFAIEDTRHGGGDNVSTLAGFGSSINLDIPHLEGTFGGDGWVIDEANPNARCTSGGNLPPTYSNGIFLPQDYWSGNWMHIPWVGKQEILRNPPSTPAGFKKSGSAPLMTKNMWAFECLATTANNYPGEGFVAISPEGEKYYFDWVVSTGYGYKKWTTNYGNGIASLVGSKVYFFVTRIEDRFGNWVKYSYDKYNNNRLTAIDSSDGRFIHVIAWVNGDISTVESSIGTWHYAISETTENHQFVVTFPDGSQASYFGTGSTDIEPAEQDPYYDPQPHCVPPQTPFGLYEFSVVLPSGAMANYEFSVERHYISNVPKKCNAYVDGSMHSVQFLTIPNFHDAFTLMSKTVSGPGLPTSQWTYSYPSNGVPDIGAFQDVCDNPSGPNACPLASTTIVSGPDRTYKTYKYGQKYKVNSGQLLSLEEGYETGTAPNITRVKLRTTQNTYVSDAEAAAALFPAQVGSVSTGSADNVGSLLRPLKSTSIDQDGVIFNWQVASTCNGNNTLCFDKRANPLTVVKSSTLGYSRTETTLYATENTTKWILNLVAKVTCMAATPSNAACDGQATDSVESETTYDSNYGLPLTSKAFGKVQQTLDYNFTTGDQDGTLKSIKDGLNNITTLTSWYRGIPRTITYPATTDQPTPVTMKAEVDDAGRVTSVTDENGIGYTTYYGYDTMGRLESIVYPYEDNGAGGTYKKWNDTTITYAQVGPTTTEYGIPGGHWKRTESTGDSRKVTYYDGLWRPLVEKQYDTADSATTSFVVKRYDTSGRLAFQAYPVAALTSYADAALTGVDTFYDALDRVTKVAQDWEGTPQLTTTTVYLPGFKTQVTNPRAIKTITGYMAFDQPTTDWPVDIDQADTKAEEADTDIVRDAFGKPISITRRNPSGSLTQTRSYVYDDGQRLCKTLEPETGATLVDYDGAGNVLWSAAGRSQPSLSCDRNLVPTDQRVVRSYDARNRLKSLAFPDGRGNQGWTYTPDSLPGTITTANNYDNTLLVINAYHYNRRRMMDGAGDTVTEDNWYTWGIGYGYDANGHQSIQLYPSGLSVDFAPNALGQPKQAGTYATGVTYYPNGAIKHFVYGNGIVHDMHQNDRQLPDWSKDANGGTNILYDSYTYDNNGNVAAISDGLAGSRGDRTMQYDALDRLTQADSPMFGNGATGSALFSYDALDNLTKLVMPDNGKATTTVRTQYYCYDASVRLASLRTAANCGGSVKTSLGYDAQGNLASKDTQAYSFGQDNRLYVVANVEAYRYDGLGHRVLAWSAQGLGNILSQYSRDGQLLQVSNVRTGIRSENVYLGGSLVAIRETPISGGTSTVKYQHTDALGTPVAVTSSTKAVLERSEYEPYGQLLNRPQHDGPGYTGHVQDAQTGLTYMQQRYYDPMLGRFLSVDPVTAYEKPGQNYNRYWYGNDNPYKFTDPDGRDVVISGSDDFKKEMKTILKQIKSTPTGKEMVKTLEKSKNTFTFFETGGDTQATPGDGINAQNGQGSGGNIEVNPTDNVLVLTANGPEPAPVEVRVGHEIAHAVDYDKGTLDRSEDPATGVPRSEEKAMKVENQIRKEMNLPERSIY